MSAQEEEQKPGTEVPTLEWGDINFTVTDAKKRQRHILKNVSGCLRQGRLTCVLGPSGAGKTSLLNLLSGRSVPGHGKHLDGVIALRGKVINPSKERAKFAYVMQEDALWPTATVREAIDFAAQMRGVPNRRERVDTVIDDLGLRKCADSIIGSQLVKGISGGEKKRVGIGTEIVSQPQVLFLDEPTSGLDSYSAKMSVDIMKNLCRKGRAVLCTIHQPSSEIFHVFDDAIFLCGGRIVYQGPISSIKHHFEAVGHPCPEGFNVADHVMGLMQTLPEPDIAALCDRFEKDGVLDLGVSTPSTSFFLRTPRRSSTGALVDAEATADTAEAVPPAPNAPLLDRGTSFVPVISKGLSERAIKCKRSIWFQCGPLLQREWRNLYRDKNTLFVRLVIQAVIFGMFAVVFFQRGDISRADYSPQSHFGALTMVSVSAMFSNANPVLLTFPAQRPVFMREYAGGLYSAAPYIISKTVIDCLVTAVMSLYSWLICYWLMGFNGNFFTFSLITFLLGMAASSLGLFVSSCVSEAKRALEASPLLLVPQILFAGFYLPLAQIPAVLRWIQWICFLNYSVKLLVIAEFFWDTDVRSKIDEVQDKFPPAVKKQAPELYNSLSPVRNCNADVDLAWLYFLVLIGLTLAFRVLCCICLAYKGRKSVQ